jgi:hypothetical protein
VFTVAPGTPFRMRAANPYGTSRGTTFQLHGHVWQRDPYVCPGTQDSILGRCATSDVGSQAIGDNRQAFYQGGQESITPATHFDIVPTQTGSAGDYLFRDGGSFGNASGLWGIVRVGAAAPAAEEITIINAEARRGNRQGRWDWTITGTTTVPGPGNQMTAVLQRTGQTIGTAAVSDTGTWTIDVRNSRVAAQTGDVVVVTSTFEGTALLAVSIIN